MIIINFKRDPVTIVVLSVSFSYVPTPHERRKKRLTGII
jgi:hypothetical protein